MRKRFIIHLITILVFSFVVSSEALGQDHKSTVEVGGVLSVIDLRDSIGEKTIGVGGRFTYNLANNFALDTEVLRYPEQNGYYGYTQAVAGLKAGARYEIFGAFAKVRPGVIHFNGGGFRATNNGSKSNLAVDIGGVLEFYSSPTSRRVALRIDFGDTIIPFGNDVIMRGGTQLRPGTTHNFQTSIGISVRL